MRKAVQAVVGCMGFLFMNQLVAQLPTRQANPDLVSYSRLLQAAKDPGNWRVCYGMLAHWKALLLSWDWDYPVFWI